MKSFEALIQQCDQDIRAGRSHEVGKRLARLNTARIGRPWRLPLAKICRRAGLYSMGLRLLGRLIHPNSIKSSATPAEQAEYAVLLLRSGVVQEANQRLRLIDASIAPEVLLYRAFGHFLQWEYQTAAGLLEKYLQTPLEPYPLLVGRTNLAMANVELREHEKALAVLDDNIRDTHELGSWQLQSTCYALKAQVYLQEKDFLMARENLDSARRLASLAQTNDGFLLTKCQLIVDGLEHRSVAHFEQLRRLSLEGNYWEAYREADLYQLKIDYQRERFLHLYFGTPFEKFRDLIALELGERPEQGVYVLGKKTAPRFDLKTGEVDGIALLNPGKKCHQFLAVMLRDFYHPLRIGGLFSSLFPGEHFDISSSPDRVRQLIRRTRRWIGETNIPIQIVETDGFYFLRLDGNFSFRVPRQSEPVEPFAPYLETIGTIFKDGQTFTAKDLQEKLALPKWTAHRFIKWGIEKGRLIRAGSKQNASAYQIIQLRHPLAA